MHFVSTTTNKQYSTDSVTQVSQFVSSCLAAHLCVCRLLRFEVFRFLREICISTGPKRPILAQWSSAVIGILTRTRLTSLAGDN